MLGSAVNPVLREGNSDRRAPASVKQYARNRPHRMGAFSKDSKTHVAHMSGGDFYGSEKAVTVGEAGSVRIEFQGADGKAAVLKDKIALKAGEVIDAAAMSRGKLRAFFEQEIEDAKKQGLLFSLHVKTTMMKISDPIIFGHAVSIYYKDVLEKHAAALKQAGFNPSNGIGDLYGKLASLPADTKAAIEKDLEACLPGEAQARDGELRQGNHQFPRPERRDHRCFHACDDPRIGQDVGPRRQT